VEVFVLRPEYASLLTEEERAIARARLRQYEYVV
jgi:hypothetical protein